MKKAAERGFQTAFSPLLPITYCCLCNDSDDDLLYCNLKLLIMAKDFNEHLRRQLLFIHNSCEAFDKGYQEEAIRVASAVRNLVKDSRNMTSVLTHLGVKDSIHLLTTVEPNQGPDFDKTLMYDGCLMFASFNNPHLAAFDAHTFHKGELSVEDWWNQVIQIFGGVKITREKLILSAADKEGGSHIDADTTPEYEKLTYSWKTSKSDNPDNYIQDVPFSVLRQIGYEILNSQELLKIVATRQQ